LQAHVLGLGAEKPNVIVEIVIHLKLVEVLRVVYFDWNHVGIDRNTTIFKSNLILRWTVIITAAGVAVEFVHFKYLLRFWCTLH